MNNDDLPWNRGLKELRDRQESERRLQQRIDGAQRAADSMKKREGEVAPSGDFDVVAVFFGLIGALFGGVLKPFGFGGFMGAFLGFLSVGIGAGVMKKYAWGRAVLWVVGLGFVAMMIYAINKS
ncbi:MAG: hypothetical protein KDB53_08010 [Planctomycetes bacterium]|nr:hypothetical protein [Planctomycetota bacterium]